MKITTELYQRNEIIMHSEKAYVNPFLDVDIDAVFTHESGEVIAIPGFWNGENEWKVRFSATKIGKWSYTVTCTDKENNSLCDSGEIIAEAVKNPVTDLQKHGYPRLEEGKRYFVYDDGTPFFYLADTHWMMPDYEHLHECNYPGCTCGNQFKHVVDDRKKKGFNVYQTYFASSRSRTSSNGVEGWWAEPFTLINPQAFNESMDIMMEYLTENGFAVSLGFGTHFSTIRAYNNEAAPVLRFVRYAIARYACYPIIWLTAQEITTPHDNAFEIWRSVGAEVGRLDGYHHPNGAHMHVHPASDKRSQIVDKCDWHQWWTLQGGHGGYDNIQHRNYYKSYYELPSKKPMIETENQYEDIYCSGFCGHDAPRMGAWSAVQNGSAGFTYGVEGLWCMDWDPHVAPHMTRYNPEGWVQGVDKEGSQQVGYMKKFYEYVGWQDLTPEYGFVFGNFDMRAKTAISHKDKDIIVYYFFARTPDCGTLCDLAVNTRYQARLFDTITGKFVDLEDIITPDGTYPIPKFPQGHTDWVLLLNTYDLGPYETEPFPVYNTPISCAEATPGEKYEIKAYYVSDSDDSFPAENLFDGNPETVWKGFKPYVSSMIKVDLGEAKELGYLHLNSPLETLRFIEYRIWASNDGENWDLLVERYGARVAVGGNYKNFYEPISGKYRFVKFFLNSVETRAPFNTPLELTAFDIYSKK